MTRQPTGRRAVELYCERDGWQDYDGIWRAPCMVCAETKKAQSLRCVRRPPDVLGFGSTLICCAHCKADLQL